MEPCLLLLFLPRCPADAGRHRYALGRDWPRRRTRGPHHLPHRRPRLGDRAGPPGAVLEVGCGTARNLRVLARTAPAKAGAQDRVALEHGRAQTMAPTRQFGRDRPFDVIFFSYVLSMIPDWPTALRSRPAAPGPGRPPLRRQLLGPGRASRLGPRGAAAVTGPVRRPSAARPRLAPPSVGPRRRPVLRRPALGAPLRLPRDRASGRSGVRPCARRPQR